MARHLTFDGEWSLCLMLVVEGHLSESYTTDPDEVDCPECGERIEDGLKYGCGLPHATGGKSRWCLCWQQGYEAGLRAGQLPSPP